MPRTALRVVLYWWAQGQRVGRCRVSRRPDRDIRPGMAMRWRRVVSPVIRAGVSVAVLIVQRVRLWARVARLSQAALALNRPDGQWRSPLA